MLFESFYAYPQNSLASERGIVGINAEVSKFALLRYQIPEFLEKLRIIYGCCSALRINR